MPIDDIPETGFVRSRTKTPKSIVAYRKSLVARLYLTNRYTIDGICEFFLQQHGIKLAKSTVGGYLDQMKKQWQLDAMRSTHEHVTGELAKLQELEDLLIQEYENDGIQSKHFADALLKIAKRRSCLLGLDKAQKFELHDKRTSELTDAELEEVITTARQKDEEKEPE